MRLHQPVPHHQQPHLGGLPPRFAAGGPAQQMGAYEASANNAAAGSGSNSFGSWGQTPSGGSPTPGGAGSGGSGSANAAGTPTTGGGATTFAGNMAAATPPPPPPVPQPNSNIAGQNSAPATTPSGGGGGSAAAAMAPMNMAPMNTGAANTGGEGYGGGNYGGGNNSGTAKAAPKKQSIAGGGPYSGGGYSVGGGGGGASSGGLYAARGGLIPRRYDLGGDVSGGYTLNWGDVADSASQLYNGSVQMAAGGPGWGTSPSGGPPAAPGTNFGTRNAPSTGPLPITPPKPFGTRGVSADDPSADVADAESGGAEVPDIGTTPGGANTTAGDPYQQTAGMYGDPFPTKTGTPSNPTPFGTRKETPSPIAQDDSQGGDSVATADTGLGNNDEGGIDDSTQAVAMGGLIRKRRSKKGGGKGLKSKKPKAPKISGEQQGSSDSGGQGGSDSGTQGDSDSGTQGDPDVTPTPAGGAQGIPLKPPTPVDIQDQSQPAAAPDNPTDYDSNYSNGDDDGS